MTTQSAAIRGVRLAAPRAASRQIARRSAVIVRAAALDKRTINKVVLAYSGGLDTSVILKWLQDTYDCEVVTFTADLGQVSMSATAKAEHSGSHSCHCLTAVRGIYDVTSCIPLGSACADTSTNSMLPINGK